jgi:NAD kinase
MGLRIDQKIVIVTRPTQLAALKRKFSTPAQAKFQIVSSRKRELARSAPARGGAELEAQAEQEFGAVVASSQKYDESVKQLRGDLDFGDFDLPVQTVDRDFLPNFVFGPHDVVVTVGQDGLVANTAKYALGLPIVAVNPDPQQIDGVLLPFRADQARDAVRAVLNGRAAYREVTLAEAILADGQRLLAFNELFIGNRTHVSARYRLTVAGHTEAQSSSGLLVCTGAGSTGWLSSIFNMTAGLMTSLRPFQGIPQRGAPTPVAAMRLAWEDPRLVYVVREPFASKTSGTNLVAGLVDPGHELAVESDMPANGVIFSDGVESDYLEFNAGATARIAAAAGKAKLVIG